MKGVISWTAEGEDTDQGNVTVCKQDGSRLNVVFITPRGGEGQISLVITTAMQFVSARFFYPGERGPTCAGVEGQLSWQPDSFQFEGTWEERDYDTVWSFSIEVDGFEFATGTVDLGHVPDPEMASLGEILDTLGRRYFTDWFEPEITPALPGVYRVEPHYLAPSHVAYANWDGVGWSGARGHADELDGVCSHEHVAHGARRWFGLTEEGSRRVARLLAGVTQRKLERKNTHLLAELRRDEAALRRARAEAHAVYLQLGAQIEGSGQAVPERQALRNMLDRMVGAAFNTPVETTFDETTARTAEGAHVALQAALEDNAARIRYWRTYWQTVMTEHEALAEQLTSKGLVIGYGKDMQARLGKQDPMQPLPGSFGTKRRA